MIEKLPHVALLAKDENLKGTLNEVLQGYILLEPVRTIQELLRLVETSPIEAVFFSTVSEEQTWKAKLNSILENCPDLPVIVLSSQSGEEEWIEVLASGAFDLLVPPYDQRTVFAVVEHALASSESRRWQEPQLRLKTIAS